MGDVMQGPHLFQRWKTNEKIVLTIMVFEHIFALWMLILASVKLCCSKKVEDSDAPNDVESPEGTMVASVQPVAGFTPVNINAGIMSRRHSANPTSMHTHKFTPRSGRTVSAQFSSRHPPSGPGADFIVIGGGRK